MKTKLGILSLIVMSGTLMAAQNNDRCMPEPSAPCYPDDCKRCYCLGPENIMVNAPVCPRTCGGDFSLTAAGLYWKAHQDGLAYGIMNDPALALIDAEYLEPDFKGDVGFKLGLSYCIPCDSWDIGILWTSYHGKASSHVEAEEDDNRLIFSLWSRFPEGQATARDVVTKWDLDLDLIDVELGREYWSSKYLSLRPFVGIRVAFIRQDYNIQYKGGFGNERLIEHVELENKFKGIGLRTGLNTIWNLGCGWALYGNFAANLIYGRFNVDHDDFFRQSEEPFAKIKSLETEEHFHATRFIGDLALGIQYSTLVCDCKYGILAQLGWEQHIFLKQNQMWRVPFHTFGIDEIIFQQQHGDLDTRGLTLSFRFSW